MNNFYTILPVYVALLYVSILGFLIEFDVSFKAYLFSYNWLLYIFSGGLLRLFSITISHFWFLFYSFVNSWLFRFFSVRHLNLSICHIRFSLIIYLTVRFFNNLCFWLWLSLPEISNVFYSKLPLALQFHFKLHSASRLDLPISDPFGPAYFALRYCFSPRAFHRRNYF